MRALPSVVVFGEVILDLIAGPTGDHTPHTGGSPFNVALALARQDIPVHLLSPLVHVYATDVEAYFCFQELMRRLEWALTFEGCKQMAVTFMTLLRHTLPDLYFYFEEEQCSGGGWLFSWLQFLLARELPLPCVLRLWDRHALGVPSASATRPARDGHPSTHGPCAA